MTDPNTDPHGPSGDAAFWHFVGLLMKRWTLVLPALLMVVLSSAALGVGMLGASPVLQNILGAGKDLPAFAREFNESLARSAGRSGPGRLLADLFTIPPGVIERLPAGAFTALWVILAVLAVLTVLGSLANFLHAYLALTAVNRTVTTARRRAFHAALRAPLGVVTRLGPGDLVSRIVNDSSQLANGLSVLLSKAVLQVFKGIAAIGVALVFDWRVTLVAVLVTPVLYLVIRNLGKRIRRHSGEALRSQGDLYTVASESLSALRVVKADAAQCRHLGEFHRRNLEMLRELNRLRTARAVASPLTETLSILLLCGLVLAAGSAVIRGQVVAHDFILVLAALGVAGASLKPLTGILGDIQIASPAARRLREVIDLHPEPGLGRGLPRLARHARDVEFRSVTFSYPGAHAPALRDISLTIPHGRRVAFVGPNGCGKTTLLSLIPRLFDPQEGSVLIDGTDIRAVSLRSLRRQVGVVTQETVLFRGTIRDNIAHGLPGAREVDIERAARLARAHEFIQRLPRGYDSMVGEGGTGLSGGQRQRIAIARAILRDPAILILDEATSMIDTESEARIAEALAEFSAGRTTLVVAHRLATVLRCDEIVVMDRGTVLDRGTHESLLARCPLYRDLAGGELVGAR
jgi:subfamily B ATP-binding cassette protein MsbA